jgi:hypothetical protein
MVRLKLKYPALTKVQIAELQKALPRCKIFSNPKKQSFLPVKVLEGLPPCPEMGESLASEA